MENEYNQFNDSKGENLLNQQELIRELIPLEPTSGNKRFANYLIDLIALYLLNTLIGVFFGLIFLFIGVIIGADANSFISSNWFAVLFYLPTLVVYFGYFAFLEYFTGKTLGKVITKTKAIRQDGSKISINQALGRSLARLIPFELFSFLGNPNPIGWHDRLSKTIVVNDNKMLEMMNKEQLY